MSFYHYRKNDPQNNIGGKAIHLLHYYPGGRGTLLGACLGRDKAASVVELAVFGAFFRWYFRIRSKAVMDRIKSNRDALGICRRVISDIQWGWLSKMYDDAKDFGEVLNEP